MSERHPQPPPDVVAALARADRLEAWSLFWMGAVVAMMSAVAGGSQAFRTAWIEDFLSLLPPAFYLMARWLEKRPARPTFPFGFHRAGSLAFFFSAAVLSLVGGLLLVEGAWALIAAEHPTVDSISMFGEEIWMGWLMVVALGLSVIPPVLLGRRKRDVAMVLHDKALFTDAEMSAADWQTGLAGITGIVGIAFGLWWADALMAIVISTSILRDGINGLMISVSSLLDGAPRKLDSREIDGEAERIVHTLRGRYRDVHVQIRETGRYFRASIEPAAEHHLPGRIAGDLMPSDSWRLLDLSVALRDSLPPEGSDRPPKV